MKEICLILLLIILPLLISHSVAFTEEIDKPGVAEAQYIPIDYENFNKSIMSTKAEEWTSDPLTVSLKFTGPFEGLTQNIERKNDSAESPGSTTIVIINEGLLDDSVMGEKYFLILKKTEHGAWLITSARKMVKCWKDRGHQDYSKEPCN